jgi:hypothetical protein
VRRAVNPAEAGLDRGIMILQVESQFMVVPNAPREAVLTLWLWLMAKVPFEPSAVHHGRIRGVSGQPRPDIITQSVTTITARVTEICYGLLRMSGPRRASDGAVVTRFGGRDT